MNTSKPTAGKKNSRFSSQKWIVVSNVIADTPVVVA